MTVTAGTASADVTVSSATLSTGTVIWSNPGDGSGVSSIVPAVPSSSGVADVFAFNADGTVDAITSDGTTAWTANLNGAQGVPDFQGGLVVANGQSITKLDGITGQPYPSYTVNPSTDSLFSVVVHTDGTIFAIDGSNYSQGATGTLSLVAIDPTTGAQKFSVALDQSTSSSNYSNTSNCGILLSALPMDTSTSTWTTSTPPQVLGGPIIAGDGYAYLAYAYGIQTLASQSTKNCAPTEDSGSGTTTEDTVSHLMLLRVGTDGSSSKIDVKDWESTYLEQAASGSCYEQDPQNGNWGWVPCGSNYDSAVQSGTVPNVQGQVITNADQGVLLGWAADMPSYCPSASYGVCGSQVPATTAFGLAITSGAGVASSATPNLPAQATAIYPVLQAQDGSFVGAMGVGPSPGTVTQYNMVSFTSSGNVTWIVPNDWPQFGTVNGGVIGYSGTTYDSSGDATGQLGTLPAYSWSENWYSSSGAGTSDLAIPPVEWPTSYGAMAGGNLSSNGTYVGVTELYEGLPVFALKSWGPSCTLDSNKVPLGGGAIQQYNNEKQQLLSGPYLTSPSCSKFFSSIPNGQSYFSQFTNGVSRQVPYDGVQTNISQFDAGMVSAADVASNPIAVNIKKISPVCALFLPWHGPHGLVQPQGKATAASQILPLANGPATDVYINTNPKTLKSLTQATILHEVLHNLTGMYDEQLENLLGLDPARNCPSGSICITQKLENVGCAGKD